MIWEFINTEFNNGSYNMNYDLLLANCIKPETAILRFYRWKPYCISIGANQMYNTIDEINAEADDIDVVKRPTGGRAILHSEELTYSVVYSLENPLTKKELYSEINIALKKGLTFFDSKLDKIHLEEEQPHFPSLYKKDNGNLCFAVSAKNELKFEGKKLVGSAQRKLNNSVLQHGSILCGDFHKNIVDYLFLSKEETEKMRTDIHNTTTSLNSILNNKINYDLLTEAIRAGFEDHFNIKFNNDLQKVNNVFASAE